MAITKKGKKPASTPASKVAASTGGEPLKKGPAIGYLVITPPILGIAAFASVYLLPVTTSGNAPLSSSLSCAPSALLQGTIEPPGRSLEAITFVALEPLVVSLGSSTSLRHLKIHLTLETTQEARSTIERAIPKLRDAFTGYLRAVRFAQLDDPSAMARIRAQLLRRAKVVLGERHVDGVLITDFVLT